MSAGPGLTSKNERKLQRHQGNLSSKIEEAHALVRSLVEIKIEQEEEITEWPEDQEETLERYEESLGSWRSGYCYLNKRKCNLNQSKDDSLLNGWPEQ